MIARIHLSIFSSLAKALVVLTAVVVGFSAHAQTGSPRHVSGAGFESLSLEELMSVRIVSASNLSEQLIRAPATVIVISRREIEERGYVRLSEILDDLPAMEMVRPYGPTWFKNYWRGYRNTVGDPFLLMIDGIVFNHLYFNTADVMDAFPLSNIQRVEIVYGPASSVYGPNATMGVINVITSSDRFEDGSSQRIHFTGGSFDRVMGDLHYFYKKGDFRISLTTRFDNGEVDPGVADESEYTRNRYYADPALWGGFIENPTLGGEFESPHQHRALDLRAWVGDMELGVQYFLTDNGYGLEYPADRAQNRAVWARDDLSLHLRRTHDFSEAMRSTTLVRYRESGVEPESWFVQSPLEPGPRVVDFSYWMTANQSLSAFQDFEMDVDDDITL
ncbi:MAG: TonB-dependent receptor, partial [Thermoanaerobaculia bacterium]|nr:TonB-dependent receptor [Thermoanaerobaculia bacterium]